MANPQILRKTKQIVIDGDSVCRKPASAWRGLGMVVGNGTSHLLTDYAQVKPEVYDEILRLLFLPGYGAGIQHLTIELGSDTNGEPCTKRGLNAPADVTQCASFRIAADAVKLNPSLTLELRAGDDPDWVKRVFANSDESGYAMRFQWLRDTLHAAFETYGLQFSYVSPVSCDEEQPDAAWLLYAAAHLKGDAALPYPASELHIVAPDIPTELLTSKTLRNAIDVIARKSPAMNDEIRTLHEEYGKELWYVQGAAPANDPSLTCRIDKCGLSGRGCAIDIANRILGCFPNGNITLYSFQSALKACYGTEIPGQLLTADTPWSGSIEPGIGLWIARHFTKFTDPGWLYLESACFRDGEETRAVRRTNDAYLTLCAPDGRGLTMILTNDSDAPRSYLVVLKNMPALPEFAYIIETIGNDDPWLVDVDWFKATEKVKLSGLDGEIAFPVVVKPNSIMTITTEAGRFSHVYGDEELSSEIPDQARLPMPFTLDFTDSEPAPLGKPLYLDDQSGTFRLVSGENGNYLEQFSVGECRTEDDTDPFTCFGDDMWADYQAVTEADFADESPDNYVGIGIRNNCADDCSGFQVLLYADGHWEFWYQEEVLQSGTMPDFVYGNRHKLGIGAIGTLIMCFADGHSLCEMKLDNRPLIRAGRAGLASAFFRNRFYRIEVRRLDLPLPLMAYVYRQDCLSQYVRFDAAAETGWRLQGMADVQHYSRTCVEGAAGAAMEIRFYGAGIFLLGKTEYAKCRIFLDDDLYSEEKELGSSGFREVFLTIEPLQTDWHTLRMEVLDGKLCFDCFEIPTNDESPEYDSNFPDDPERAESLLDKKMPFDLKKATLPLAGAAANGLAMVFTLGKLGDKLHKLRFRRKK